MIETSLSPSKAGVRVLPGFVPKYVKVVIKRMKKDLLSENAGDNPRTISKKEIMCAALSWPVHLSGPQHFSTGCHQIAVQGTRVVQLVGIEAGNTIHH